MNISLVTFTILVVAFVHKVSTVNWYNCTCIPYDQCNLDYTVKKDATDIHEKRTYNNERPRPVCNEPIDVCCDFPNETANTNKENNNREWSCGIRGTDNDVRVGEVANAEQGEFPWVVAIFRNGYGYYAGGSLINGKAILTVAHKFSKLKPSQLIIHAGLCNLRSVTDTYYEGTVSSIHIHPNFEEQSHVNDYAVLILTESAKPWAHVNSICLADSDDTYQMSQCIATGWGKSREDVNRKGNHLQKSHVHVIDREKCENNYQEVYSNYNYKIHTSVICVGDDSLKDPCVGDAGSPIICPIKYNSKRYVQVGISSTAVCNEKHKPGLYADVANGYEWIFQVVESHGLSTKTFTT